ncbi:MAG: GNAT family N-acetyltransferase [Burkholderiaceae bacterium]|nr:GNAT family N-acetyltransferase [Burkholderiaceae bacterium]
MSEAAIRVATSDDAAAFLPVLRQAYAPLVRMGFHFTATRVGLDEVREALRKQSTFLLERTETSGSRKILASATVRFPWLAGERHYAPYPCIRWVFVVPDAQGQGLAHRMLDHVEDGFLRQQIKAPAVYLGTASRHPWLPGLYERRGYEPFHHNVNPLGIPLVWLRKVLIPDLYAALESPREWTRDFPGAA